jgi:hypothetical protein
MEAVYAFVILSLRAGEESASDFGCLSQGNNCNGILLIRSVLIIKHMGLLVTTKMNMTSFVHTSDCYHKSNAFRCHLFDLTPS